MQLSSRILFTSVVVFEIFYNSLAGAYIHTYIQTGKIRVRKRTSTELFFFFRTEAETVVFFFFQNACMRVVAAFFFPFIL